MTTKIYINLLEEGLKVCRPVKCICLKDNIYFILEQEYNKDVEMWEFEPGDKVVCEMQGGDLYAVQRYND